MLKIISPGIQFCLSLKWLLCLHISQQNVLISAKSWIILHIICSSFIIFPGFLTSIGHLLRLGSAASDIFSSLHMTTLANWCTAACETFASSLLRDVIDLLSPTPLPAAIPKLICIISSFAYLHILIDVTICILPRSLHLSLSVFKEISPRYEVIFSFLITTLIQSLVKPLHILNWRWYCSSAHYPSSGLVSLFYILHMERVHQVNCNWNQEIVIVTK